MDLSRVIIGSILTEKAERMKLGKVYVLQVDQNATKVDVGNALRRFYGVEVKSIRSLRTRPKSRVVGAGKEMEKRHRSKRMMVTLAKDSANLDLVKFRS